MAYKTPILCLIQADESRSADLETVVNFCSSQTGIPLEVIAKPSEDINPVVTLYLAPDQASADNPIWCLVCRLACLCPQARVGALIHARTVFAPSDVTIPHSA